MLSHSPWLDHCQKTNQVRAQPINLARQRFNCLRQFPWKTRGDRDNYSYSRVSIPDAQFAKITILRDNDAPFTCRPGKNQLIGIGWTHVACPNNIMAATGERRDQSLGEALVDEKPHSITPQSSKGARRL